MPNINLNYKMVTDIKNNFFTNNRFIVAESLPAEGDFVKGDLIVNIGENANDEAMWLCVESGNPGVWEVVGAGAGGGSSKIVTLKSRVVVNEALSEVNIGVSGFNKATDTLIAFNNARFMVEGVDYEINDDSTKIVAMNGNIWNEELANDFVFDFVVFKMMNVNENGEVVVSSANEIVKLKNTVVVNEAVNEVEIGIEGFNEGDDLTVYRNSVYMIEGIDYEVQGSKIVSLKGVWNVEDGSDYKFTFEVLKAVAKINPDAVVGMEHLTEDVKEAIEAAGNIDLSGYATKEELNNIDISGKQDVTDEELITNDKTIVGAINELFINANNGKQLIADAIGNDLITVDSTFSAMSEAIIGLHKETSSDSEDSREVLYNMMIEDGYDEATSDMTVDELIELLDESNIEISEIKQIACSGNHTFILKNDGSVYSCGYNEYGQLGLGDTTNRTSFTQVTANIDNDVEQIACGNTHTVILKNDGSVYSCGENGYGQLGLGDTTNRTSFTQVTTNIDNDVKQIACGQYHTLILKNDGSIYGCGDNDYGQLGLGDTTNRTSFTQATTNINNDVAQIVCGYYHIFIIKTDGSVYSCGENGYGQLGLGDTTDRTTFTQVTTNVNNDVKQIACGGNHTFILKNDGSVYSCGRNYYGQLGLGYITDRTTFTQVTTNINNDVEQIACGANHTVILKNDGSVYSCGYNIFGHLGLGDTTTRTTFTQVTTNINNDVEQIACGQYHTFILKNDGSVYSCGRNNYGQLGLGDNTNRTTFTNVPLSTSITEYEISRLKLYYYLLDNNIDVTEDMDIGTMLDCLITYNYNNKLNGYITNLKIVLIDEGVEVTDEDDMNSLITKTDEEFAAREAEVEEDVTRWYELLKLAGYDVDDTDGMDELYQALKDSCIAINDVEQIACGGDYTFILKNDGSVYSCGYNYFGQLGLGDTTDRTSFTQVTININNDVEQIACGYGHTFILKNDGSVYSCGYNNKGQLGLGDTINRTTFTQVTTNINNDVTQIACGGLYTFILKNDGSVYSCGYNEYGELGLGSTSTKTTFTQVTTNINNDVKQIACGYNHTFILKNDGSVYSCGYNNYGQLGLGTSDSDVHSTFTQVTTNINNDVSQIACGWYHTFILKNDGSVYSCGENGYGQLGLGNYTNKTSFTQVTTNIDNDVKQIICGWYHTFILKNDSSVYSCGSNYYGQLGLGDRTDRTSFTQVTTNINNDVKQIACGAGHTFILKNDGSIWACGFNEYGGLGLGDTTDRTSFSKRTGFVL